MRLGALGLHGGGGWKRPHEQTDGTSGLRGGYLFVRGCEVSAGERVVLEDEKVRALRYVSETKSVSVPRTRRIGRVKNNFNIERSDRLDEMLVKMGSVWVGLDAGNYLRHAGISP